MENVSKLAEYYKNTPETFDEVIEYLNKYGPSGNYQGVVKTFQSEGKEGCADDKAFYWWLRENYDKGLVSLGPLSQKEGFENFVFRFGNIKNPFYNQKWHFYVSYLAYREFATRAERKPKGVTVFTKDGDEYLTGPFRFHKELKKWYEQVDRIR